MPIIVRLKYVWSVLAAMAALLTATAALGSATWETHVVGAERHGINTLGLAMRQLDGNLPSRFDVTTQFNVLNFNLADWYDGGMFRNDASFPGVTPGHENDFVLDARAWVNIPFAGDYTFGVSSDDGWRLKVDDFSHQRVGLQAPKNTYMHVSFAQPGMYPIEMTYFQHHQRAELELYATFGDYTHFGQLGSNFQLIGSPGGLQLAPAPDHAPVVTAAVPEPSAKFFILVAGSAWFLLRRPTAAID